MSPVSVSSLRPRAGVAICHHVAEGVGRRAKGSAACGFLGVLNLLVQGGVCQGRQQPLRAACVNGDSNRSDGRVALHSTGRIFEYKDLSPSVREKTVSSYC